MKSFKQPKEKGEQVPIQGSISKSTIGSKKSSKSPRGQHQKKADKGSGLQTINQMPPKIKPANEIMLRSSPKIKLQLFPIDEKFRIGLEKDGHNPFLELTLSSRKKISSVLKHLYNKWGSSSIAIGELMLFPFNIAAESLTSCRRWTSSDIGIRAGDIHAMLGNPEIFRLSYGWVSFQPNTSPSHCTKPGQVKNVCRHTMEDTCTTRNGADGTSKPCNEEEFIHMAFRQPVIPEPLPQVVNKNQDEVKSDDFMPSKSSKIENYNAVEEDPSAEPLKHEEPRVDTGMLWSDLSNISIGGLLSEVSMQGRLLSQTTVADSLDAFIEQFKYPQAGTTISSMPSSILDAENTCHSFAFSKQSSSGKDLPTIGRRAFSGLSDHNAASDTFKSPKSEVNAQGCALGNTNVQEPKTDCLPFSSGVCNNENSLGFSSIRWNDSLGPFDLPLTSRQIIKNAN
ncbi:TSL-kinase interacting protein 1 isoform X2 [Spinacia oleracea]|uniref:TSL-kinase interacting protein 1 isoform X2 n=1 Tax=Spinacia oleracea TaxID=3562 RepID=A0A9R0IBX1_SPIOL|nr:TSL-kinase interacting protein 1 isoform X2 [Spinacia oleracea]